MIQLFNPSQPLAAIAEDHKDHEDDDDNENADANTDAEADTERSVPLTISFTNNKAMDTDTTFDGSTDDINDNATTIPFSSTSSSSSSSLDTDIASTSKFGQYFFLS